MDESFLVWVDRLRGGGAQKIAETLSPSFLDVREDGLRLDSPVLLKGEAYVSEGQLILHLTASTDALMPCAVCNKMTSSKLAIENFYHAEPVEQIPSGIFDFREPLREALLIELPKYVECGGQCPERGSISPYLRSEKRIEQTTYLPFKDLD